MRLLSYSLLLLLNIACAASGDNKAEMSKTQSAIEAAESTDAETTIAENVSDTLIAPEMLSFDYDTTQWTDIGLLEPSIVMDLKYATTDNFVKTKMYECARCFLRPPVAERILEIHRVLQQQGLGLKMFDCYRPRPIQQKLWEKVPDPRYVADPAKGSMHNRGGAVDLTIVKATGEELDMGTPFDYFGEEAYHTYTNHSDEIAQNRKLLKETMEASGFKSIRTEWWHYSLGGTGYPLDDMVWECR